MNDCMLWCVSSHSLPDSGPSLPVPDKSILSHHLQPKSQEDGMAASVWSAGAMPSRHVLVATHGGIIVSMLKFLQVNATPWEI